MLLAWRLGLGPPLNVWPSLGGRIMVLGQKLAGPNADYRLIRIRRVADSPGPVVPAISVGCGWPSSRSPSG